MSVDVLIEHPTHVNDDLVVEIEGIAQALLHKTESSARGLSIVLCDDTTIASLNQTWREIEGATDVLSFPMDEGLILDSGESEQPLGDVVISLDTAALQAREHGISLRDEVIVLLIHGLCHLQGHDHAEPAEAERMRGEERRLLTAVAPEIERPPLLNSEGPFSG